MKLYYYPGASSRAVHMTLRELGTPFDLDKVDLRSRKTSSGADYLKINPKGYVPAIEMDDGQILTEVTVILQYVADQQPQAELIPPWDTMDRYRAMEWLHFVASEVQKKCLGPLWNPKIPDAWRAYCLDQTTTRFNYLEVRLAERQYLMGDTYTVADAYLFVLLCWAVGFEVTLETWPALADYKARIEARPATQAVLEVEAH